MGKANSRLVKKVLKGLNPSQREGVIYGEGPCLIIAGAGTGKTTVITRRIAYLIVSKMALPDEILALTFTEKAAMEMEERVDMLVPYGYTNVWISTFHAFGDRVIRENALELGLSPDVRVLNRAEQVIFFREHLFTFPLSYYRPLGDPTRYIEAMITLFNRAKDEDVSPSEYLAYVKQLEEKSKREPENKELKELVTQQREIALTYSKYQELLAKEGKIDFGDQVSLTLRLFREHPVILRHYQERFKYILVDEFQDTNYAQLQLVNLLASRYKNITVVGDDDQSIYKFRGAAISNILGFMDTYPEARQIVLSRNYRSTQSILDSSYRLILHNNPDRLEVKNRIDKQLISCVKDKGEYEQVVHLHYDTISTEADAVAKLIRDKVSNSKYRYADFAILVRSNKDADPFLRSLNMYGIPWYFTGTYSLYSQEEIQLLIAFLKCITDLSDSPSLFYLATGEIYQMKTMDLLPLMNQATRKNLSLYYIFTHLEQVEHLEISKEGMATIEKITADISHFVELATKRKTGEVLYEFLMHTGYLKRLTSSNSAASEKKIKNIARFFDIVQGIGNILTHDRVFQFVDYLGLLIEAGDNPEAAEIDSERDCVRVLTVHSAKGLEFRVVFLVSLVSDRFPTRGRKEPIPLPDPLVKDILPVGDFHLQEERRLFYVGMTRAKEELYLTSSTDYGGKRKKGISRFVFEALDLPKAEVKTYKPSLLEVIKRNAPPATQDLESYSPIPEDEILNLSYFQIDDYLTCPLKYKFIHILRVPLLQHHRVIYGKALHDAVCEYNKRKLLGQPVTLDDLIMVFESSWTGEGFLSREHEEQRLEIGKATIRSFFTREERDSVIPTYVEQEFSFLIDRDRITGRWDRIDRRNGEVTIIDFKSSDIIRDKEKAMKAARESLQLSIYALAYYKIFGQIPKVELHFLESGLKGEAKRKEEDFIKTQERIKEASSGIRSGDYSPRPSYHACNYCAYERICPGKR
ncbi:MAG: ATP-dependent DNA helicase [bacterium]|nr:ATP-dependent DNA helicase [bacterium]